jgi:gluconokinase
VELVTAEAARFGLRGAVLHPVFGDGACNNIGVQAVGADTAALSAGTSGSIRLLLPDVIEDAPCGLWRYQLDGATTAIGGANSNVGNLFEWSRSRLGDAPPTALLADVPPELGGLVALPHLVGERGPRYRSEASGALIGLRPHHDREDLVSALVLASLGTFHELAGLVREASPSVERAIVAGGVTSAAPWYAQLLADAIALPVTVSTVRESSLSGAASLATGIRPHADPGVTYRPRIEWTKAIEAQSRRARALEEALAQVP